MYLLFGLGQQTPSVGTFLAYSCGLDLDHIFGWNKTFFFEDRNLTLSASFCKRIC